jgi:hypothetical protein
VTSFKARYSHPVGDSYRSTSGNFRNDATPSLRPLRLATPPLCLQQISLWVGPAVFLPILDTRKGTEGSNPTRSASKSKLLRNCPACCREIHKTCPYFAIFRQQIEPERTDCSGLKGVDLRAFL